MERTASGNMGGWKFVFSQTSRKINTWILYRDEKQTSPGGVVDVTVSAGSNVGLKEAELRKGRRYCFRCIVMMMIVVMSNKV
jgi:hypothetical protein